MYSNYFIEKKIKLEFQPFCRNEKELNLIINDINLILINSNLYEYFMINISELIEDLIEFYEKNKK